MKATATVRGTYLSELKHFRRVLKQGARSPDDELVFLTSELGIPRLTLDPLFRRFVSHWNDGPTLDAAYFALEAILLASPGFTLSESAHEVIVDLLEKCYLSAEGGFWPSPFGRSASLYGTMCAVGVMKTLGRHACAERPADDVPGCDSYYSEFVGMGFGKKIRSLIAQRCDEAIGACYDSAQWTTPCLISTSAASSLMWNAGYGADALLEILPKERLSSFLEQSLFTHEAPPTRWQAFRPHPDHERPGLSVTYHALRLASRLNLELPIRKESIRNFIQLCWTGEGFSSTVGESPSVISTYYAIACLQDEDLCGPDDGFIGSVAPQLLSFLAQCRTGQCYAISPTFYPNAAATRYALQILSRLGRQDLFDAKFVDSELLNVFWKDGQGFTAYPVAVVQRTSSAYTGYSLLSSFVDSLTLTFAPLRLVRGLLVAAWAHRRV